MSESKPTDYCIWRLLNDGNWFAETNCNGVTFRCDTSGFVFCPRCGKQLKVTDKLEKNGVTS